MKDTGRQAHRSRFHLLLTVVGMTGIVGLFLPFTFGTSPWDAMTDEFYWRVALPAFLTVLASAGSIRWMMSGSLSTLERTIAYIAGVSMAGVSLSVWFVSGGSFSTEEWFLLAIQLLVLALGIGVLIRNSRRGRASLFNPVMSIQVPYVAHVAVFLVSDIGDWQVGAYFVLIAALAFVLQMVLVSADKGSE